MAQAQMRRTSRFARFQFSGCIPGSPEECAPSLPPAYCAARTLLPRRIQRLRFIRVCLYLDVIDVADIGDQALLRQEIVDVLFLVLEDLFVEQTRAVILDTLGIGDGFAKILERFLFELKIAGDDLFDGFADQELVEILQVGKTAEEEDALRELVRMFH